VTELEPTIHVEANPCNPGEFFACCGLLELADRLWPGGAEGWFRGRHFCMGPVVAGNGGTLQALLDAAHRASLEQLDPADDMASPLRLAEPFGLRLDWWQDERSGGAELKTWAGQQKVVRIARAMHAVLAQPGLTSGPLFSQAAVLFDPAEPKKTVEPFYFDDRRSAQAHNLDIGFSPDAQAMSMPAYSVVEFFCLVGLQRFRPARKPQDRTYEYSAWAYPLPPAAAAAVVAGYMGGAQVQRYSFRLLFRTKYLKGFLPATPIRGD
jgi:hypothetical protein